MTRLLREDDADFVIVGTGAGGATAARVLSGAGHSVVMLEEGLDLNARERPRSLLDSMAASFRDMGTATTFGSAPIPLLQGRCVGGSTAINSGIIWRLPEDVREVWRREHGLHALVDDGELERVFAVLERELEITETSAEVLGSNNSLLELAANRLGLEGRRIHRNAARCRGSSQCLQGCPTRARQSMDVSYVPRSVAAGARLHSSCRAERIVIRGGHAVGVTGAVIDAERRTIGRFEVRAKRAVVIAASATRSPVLLARSGVGGPVGEHFRAHPGSAVVARFDDPVRMSFGATQGYEIPQRRRGFKIEGLALPPEMLAARLPGAGAEWTLRLAELDHYAQWVAQVRMEAQGTVRPGLFGSVRVRYEPTPRDLEVTKQAVLVITRLMFAAGAKEVFPGVGGWPEVVTDPDRIRALEARPIARGQLHLIASHLFGGACAGRDPRRSVVGPTLEAHAVRDLFVMDGSVFPTNLGVNPQHSIMAVVWQAAERLANRAAVPARAA